MKVGTSTNLKCDGIVQESQLCLEAIDFDQNMSTTINCGNHTYADWNEKNLSLFECLSSKALWKIPFLIMGGRVLIQMV
jgi:hypothetical protein